VTPQTRIPDTSGAQFSPRTARGSHRDWPAVFGLMLSYRLSAACAAAGVLMVMGGVAGGSSIEAPLVRSVAAQSPVTPRPVEPQPAQRAQQPQQPQQAQKPPCTGSPAAGTPSVHRGEPGYRPWVDDDHDGMACQG
jgi:hypothetical protein